MSDNKGSLRKSLTKRIRDFCLDKSLLSCDAVIVGCSGGPDSVALLTVLSDLASTDHYSFKLYAVHVNHNLRSGDCDEDEKLTADYCRTLGVPVKVISVDVRAEAAAKHLSEETAGRNIRYNAFTDYRSQIMADEGFRDIRIAVAHHRDDLAETMMMNLMRGTGLEGLVSPRARSGDIIRPLLCCSKDELVRMLDEEGISYATDKTNYETDCTRNVWRNDILPSIAKNTGTDPVKSLNRTYSLLDDDLSYITEAADKAYKDCVTTIGSRTCKPLSVLLCSKVSKLHNAIRSRVIRHLWLETFGSLTDFETANIKSALDLINIKENAGETVIPMPFDRKGYRHGDCFCFVKGEDIMVPGLAIASDMGFAVTGGNEPVRLKVPSLQDLDIIDRFTIKIPQSGLSLELSIIENNENIEYNNYSWFCPIGLAGNGDIHLVNMAGSDRDLLYSKAGAAGRKRITRVFTDYKVPESARGNILMATAGDRVLWVPGIGHSEGFRNELSRQRYMDAASDRPERLIRLEIKEEGGV